MGRAVRAIAPQAHRVELFDYPVDAIIAPEGFARNYNRRYAKDSVAIRFGACLFEIVRAIAGGVAREVIGVEITFAQHRGDGDGVFDVEFALEEALEHPWCILAKTPVAVGIDAAHHREPRVEQFLRSADYHASFVGEAADVLIEVAHFVPVVRLTLFEFAAIGSSWFEVARNEAQGHTMRSFESEGRLQRQKRKGALEIVIELYGFVGGIHPGFRLV